MEKVRVPRLTGYEFRVTRYKFRVIRYGFRVTPEIFGKNK